MIGLILSLILNTSDARCVQHGAGVTVEEIRAHGGEKEWFSFLDSVGAYNVCVAHGRGGAVMRIEGGRWVAVCDFVCK